MEDEEDSDLDRDGSLIPSICTLFCLSSLIAGILLFLYYVLPRFAQPWFPISAAILTASTFVFWILTCVYSCIMACFRRRRPMRYPERQICPCEPPPAASASAITIAVVKNNGGGGGGLSHGGKQKKITIASVDSYTPLRYSI